MNPVLRELYKIHPQSTVAGAGLMAIRGRFEQKKGIDPSKRIGGDFPNAKSLLIFGKCGTGKTKFMKSLFWGLGLNNVNSGGDTVGIYHESAGCSTVPGIASLLENYGDCVHFFDEMNLSTVSHLHLLKQICNGKISRQRYQNVEPFPFDGLILAATNGIKPPPAAEMEDLLATLDRFIVVEAKPAKIQPVEYFDAVLKYKKMEEGQRPDFKIISKAIQSSSDDDLCKEELAFARKLWREKSLEILDEGERAQYRNVTAVLDILLFTKRVLKLKNLTENEEAKSFVRSMVRDCIHFNPAPLFMLTPAQRAVYNVILEKGKATTQDIATRCKTARGAGNIHRIIREVMGLGLAYKSKHGFYATRISPDELPAPVGRKNPEAELVEHL